MTRKRNPNREKAFKIYELHKGNILLKEISAELEEKLSNIKSWKRIDKWDNSLGIEKKRGGQKGNKNSIGNNGGAPIGNFNSVKTGVYMQEYKFNIPEAITKILSKNKIDFIRQTYNDSHIDRLNRGIVLLESEIYDTMQKQQVENNKDHTRVLKRSYKGDYTVEEYEIKLAEDKQNDYMNTISKSMSNLANLIDKKARIEHLEIRKELDSILLKEKQEESNNGESKVNIIIDIPRGDSIK